MLAPVPARALPQLAQAGALVARLNGRAPLINADKVGELLHPDWAVSAAELPPERPAPRYGLESGFGATVSWYRDAGWLR
jgi:hypothetical protein